MPIVACSSCKAKLNAPDSALGKKVKCRCGALVDVPPGSAPAANAQPAKAQPAKAQSPNVQAKPSGPSNTMGQLLDQLTASDFSRAEKKVESTGPSQNQRDAKALDAFKDPNTKSGKRGGFNDGMSGPASSGMEDLSAIAILYFVFAGLHFVGMIAWIVLAVMGSGTLVVDKIPFMVIASLPTIVFDVMAGIGLLKRKAWGWWLASLGIGWVAGVTLPSYRLTIRVVIDLIRGKIEVGEVWPLLVLLGVALAIFIGAMVLLSKMIQPKMMKKYDVQVNQILAWIVCILGGVLIGVAYIVFLYVFALGTIALTTPS